MINKIQKKAKVNEKNSIHMICRIKYVCFDHIIYDQHKQYCGYENQVFRIFAITIPFDTDYTVYTQSDHKK